MRSTQEEVIIFDGVGLLRGTVTATAATDLLTLTGHGFKQGDRVQFTTATTLPAGLVSTATYFVMNPTANTFQVSLNENGPIVDITDTGTGTHTVHLRARPVFVGSHRNIELVLATAGTATLTAKVQGAHTKDMPDWNSAQSKTNLWDYTQIKDLEDAAGVDGDTGFAPSGADDIRHFEVNTNGLQWLNVVITAWTQGTLRAVASLYND